MSKENDNGRAYGHFGNGNSLFPDVNDPVDIISGPQEGSVTEITDRTHGENQRTLFSSGLISFSDGDANDTHTVSVAPNGTGYLGMLTAVIVDDDDRWQVAGRSFEHRHDGDDHDHGHGHGHGHQETGGDAVRWVFSVNDSQLDYLAAGETLTQTYTVTIDDGHGGAAQQTVSIVLHGTNDAPVITTAVAAGSITELPDGSPGENTAVLTSTGTINFTDADLSDSHVVSVAALGSDYRGTLTATITDPSTGDGSGTVGWTYSVNDGALDSLNAGDQVVERFVVTIDDGHGGLVSKTVKITLNGADDSTGSVNHDPVITSPAQSGLVFEITDGAPGENATTHVQSGAITFTDQDAGDVHTATAAPAASGYLGDFILAPVDDATGSVAWTFSVDDLAVDSLREGQVLTQVYNVTVDDGAGGTATQAVTIAITGSNDVPVISGVSTGTVVEDSNPTALSTSGALSIADPDQGESSFIAQASAAGAYGAFTLDASGNWTYTADNTQTAIQQLGAGDSLTDSFTAVSADGTASQVVAVTIQGTNDVPLLGGTVAGDVVENSNPTVLATAGNLTINDTDLGQSNFAAQAGTLGSNSLGTFTLDGAGHWTYSADNTQAAVQQLGVGDSLTDSFTAVSSDGSASETVTVTIHGVDHAPTAISLDNTNVNENTPGAVIGVVSVTDQDPGETFTYQLDDDRFEIANGDLKLKDGISLDFEQEPTVQIAISATDSGGLSVSHVFTIGVNNGAEGNTVDGYIAGATVFADANNNGVLDAGEVSTVTDAAGNFTLFGGSGPLVMTGGTDISTGLAFTGTMRAPEGSTVVTPLTTLVAAIAGVGATSQQIADANAAVLQGLGLDSNIDLATFDPIKATVSSDPTQQTQGQAAVAAAVQIQNTIVQASSLLTGAGATQDPTAAVVAALADQISTSQTLNLNDTGVLTSVITTAGTASGANSDAVTATASGAANVISASNQIITDAAGQTGTDLLTTLAQVSVVAQGSASTSLVSAGQDGTTTAIQTVESSYTGTSLTDAVSTATVGDVLGANAPLNLTGTSGADILKGGAGDDILHGLAGNDGLQGYGGNDILDGGADIDKAVYGDATGGITVDMASGTVTGAGVGTDALLSIEMIKGSNYADTYVATGFGANSANAGSNGAFNEFEGRGGDDVITGNGSTRISYLSATSGVTVNMATGTATGDASVGTDTFTGVNAVRGSNYDDTLLGTNGSDQFEGRGGSDFINGMGGNDRARYDFETAAIQVNMAAGTVTGGDAGGGQDTLRSIEMIRGTNFNDVYDATGFTASSANAGSGGVNGSGAAFNEFEGMGGDDFITGNGNTRIAFYNATGGVTVDLAAGTVSGDASVGHDTITGGVTQITGSQFDDTLLGSNNPSGTADVFDGRAGNDTFDGRGGFDQAVYNTDNAVTSGISVDMAAGTVTGDAAVGTDTLISIESVRGTNFADTFNATGFNGASADVPLGTDFNEFEGMGGNDVITGNGNTRISYVSATAGVTVDLEAGTATGNSSVGTDTFSGVSRVRGSNFNDTILGDGNNNNLEGQNGNDVLDGRGGNDILTGGGGADTFVYETGGGGDTIIDFNRAQGDHIDLTSVAGVYSLSDVQAIASLNAGANTFINFGNGDSLYLVGVTPDTLVASDFVFGTGNQAPTDITLSNAAVAENSANGTVVGSLTAVDPNAGDTAAFSLVNDAGGLFAVNGSNLVVAGALDFEAASSHQVIVQVADSGGLTFDKTFTIGVTNVNEAPTDITLSNTSVEENSANGTIVGGLSAIDQDAGDTATFTLVDDAGGLFAVNGSNLVVVGALDYESASSHQVIVRVTDSGGLTFDKTFTVGVTDVNEAPTDITLSNASVAENSANGTIVGGLSAVDQDAGDTATFTLVDDAGGLFAVNGSNLVVAGALDFEAASSHQVIVRVTDSGGLMFDKTFTVGVTDVNEAPTDITLSNASVLENSANGTVVGTLTAVDQDAGDTATFTLVDDAGGLFALNGSDVVVAGPLDYETATSHQIIVQAKDSGGLTFDKTLTIDIGDVPGITVTGDAGNNTLIGTPENDTLQGLGGNDTLKGLGGDDVLDGGADFDKAVYTDATGAITVALAAGTVSGPGVGTDTLLSIESVQGSSFDDSFDATGFGGGSANAGSFGTVNEFEGMGGNDTIVGNGNTRVTYVHAGAAVTVDLAAGTATGDASVGTDTFTGVTQVRGSGYDDTLLGSNNGSGVEQFEGRGGSDLIDGRGGFDRARYDFESAAIQVGLASGIVTGGDAGAGQDTLRSVESIRGTNYNDTYDATGFSGSSLNAGSSGTYNEFEGMGGNDTITGNGNTNIVFYNATAGVTVDLAAGTVVGDSSVGSDTITGGVTQITGSQFDDTLMGFDNPFGVANIFDGRAGNDTFDGRGGYDQAVYNNDSATTTGIVVNMAAGTVTGDASIGTDTLISIESVRGTNFADTYDATGYNGASADLSNGTDFNEFEGMGGDDAITGNGNTRISYLSAGAGVTVDLAAGMASGATTGHDTFTGVSRVRGSNYADTIYGDGNDNVLEGRNGNDVLDGRGGNDTLTGGANADTFVYETGGAADTVTDFNQSEGDRIDLTGISGVTDLASALAYATQNGADTVFDFGGGDTLTLTGVTLANLTTSDFIFPSTVETVTLTIAASSGYDMNGLYGDLGSADGNAAGATHSATYYDMINTGTGHTIHLVGTGFTYDGSNNLVGGTISEIDIKATSNGATLLTMTGFAVDAPTYISAAAAHVGSGTGGPLNDIFNQYAYDAHGSAGNDVLLGFGQADMFDGGAGQNFVDYLHYGSGIVVDLADPSQNTGNAAGDTYVNITNVIGTNYNDVLIGDGNNNALEGGAGADTLIGGGGSLDFASYIHSSTGVVADLADSSVNTGDAAGDVYIGINSLLGSNYNDTLTGDAGDNYLRGRGGADVLDGGAGSDTADYNGGQAVRADLSNPGTNTGDAAGDAYISIENLRGTSFNDTLVGDAGANTINGQGGNDVIEGGAGADTLIGGGGNDTFVFNTGFGQDTVTDFTPGSDVIQLSSTIFTDATSALAATADDGNGNTVVTVDANNTITLDGILKAQLSTTDFHVV